jgi:hypothetical protein
MDTQEFLSQLHELLINFESKIQIQDVRKKVLALVPVLDRVRDIGKSLVPKGLQMSARDRLLAYFRRYPQTILNEKELSLVAGIGEWARRVRELRVQFGWPIISGVTASEMAQNDEVIDDIPSLNQMGPNDYLLLEDRQDRDAAFRWNIANHIRRESLSMKEKILKYLRENVGKIVTGEELRYVANGSEWARRVRELRTEEGWPIASKMTGRPDLPIGAYVLEMDRQSPLPDRRIPDSIRRQVLMRDKYTCRKCGWNQDLWNPSDPRFLEIHHIKPHAEGGGSSIDNLEACCNVCHDQIHSVDS